MMIKKFSQIFTAEARKNIGRTLCFSAMGMFFLVLNGLFML
ncbi:hypothetical protein Ga0466249_004473 [Sporomusaceae bacterium BoRhaA]|nr:hypothetical protein [Pelorhabdus rhamnosifermentans]